MTRFAHLGPTPTGGLTASERKTLADGGFDLEAARPGKDARDTVAVAASEYADMLRRSLTVAEAAKLLGVNPSRIRQRLTGDRRTIYGVKVGREWRLPEFQFGEDGLTPGIGEVLPRLDPELHPLALLRWFTTPSPDLVPDGEPKPLSPRDWLRTGHSPVAVAELAGNL